MKRAHLWRDDIPKYIYIFFKKQYKEGSALTLAAM